MRSTDDDLVFYLPSEVARIFRCSEWWIKEQARNDEIPFCWIGGAYKFTPDHLKAIARKFERGASRGATGTGQAQSRSITRTTRKSERKKVDLSEPAQLTARIPPRARRASDTRKAA